MRNRLIGASALIAAMTWALAAPTAAQTPPPSGAWGGSATGELLDEDGAIVGADFTSTNAQANDGGDSGRSSGSTCWLIPLGNSGPDTPELQLADLQAQLAIEQAGGRNSVPVVRHCEHVDGSATDTDAYWGPGEYVIPPEVLMEQARSMLQYPTPTGSTTPPLDPGTVAQLPTFFHVDNWGAVSERASAGPVSATVTAEPVRQTWEVHDSVRDTSYTVECGGPGVVFDPASGAAPPADACSWTPPHSSAGQGAESEASGDPCFETTVTITWHVTWDSNVGAGGDLGEGTSSSTACLVVGEVQAVVTET